MVLVLPSVSFRRVVDIWQKTLDSRSKSKPSFFAQKIPVFFMIRGSNAYDFLSFQCHGKNGSVLNKTLAQFLHDGLRPKEVKIGCWWERLHPFFCRSLTFSACHRLQRGKCGKRQQQKTNYDPIDCCSALNHIGFAHFELPDESEWVFLRIRRSKRT